MYNGIMAEWSYSEPGHIEGLRILRDYYSGYHGKVFLGSRELAVFKGQSRRPGGVLKPGTTFVLVSSGIPDSDPWNGFHMLFQILVGSDLYSFAKEYEDFKLTFDFETKLYSHSCQFEAMV